MLNPYPRRVPELKAAVHWLGGVYAGTLVKTRFSIFGIKIEKQPAICSRCADAIAKRERGKEKL